MRPDNWNVVLHETWGGHAGGRWEDSDNYLAMVTAWLTPPVREQVDEVEEVPA